MRKLIVAVTALTLALGTLAFMGGPARGDDDGIVDPRPVVVATSRPGEVALNWSPSAELGVVGYMIRRGEAAGKEDRWPVNDFPVTGTAYTDQNVTPGTTYYYRVTPVLRDGTLGTEAAEVNALATVVPEGYREVLLRMDADEATLIDTAGARTVTLAGKPMLDRGRVLVPLADAAKALGADIRLDEATGMITQTLAAGREMRMEVGNQSLMFKTATRVDTCTPVMHDGMVYLPLRWVVESMNGTLTFDPAARTVTVQLGAQ